MNAFRPALLILALVITATPASAQQQPYRPEHGSAVRSAIMDGLRAGVRDVEGLSGNIIFRVHNLAVLGDYALMSVTPLNSDGSRIPAYENAEDMYCDKNIIALLRRTNGRGWRVIERDIGPCDYAWPYIFEQNPSYPAALLREWESVVGDLGQQLDRFLTQAADSGFSGSVLVATDGVYILHKGYGWVDARRTSPVTTTTPFWVGSISKQFAAAAILKLAEIGLLSLDDSITRFFPAVPEEKRSITLHQLLTHTAGLEQHYAADGITDRDEAVRAILAHPLVRPPGEGFGDSNDAYNLIAAVVEVVAEQPYETFLREQLLDPALMLHTGFWGPVDHPEVAGILTPEFSDSMILKPNWGYRGAVGMFSTSEDLYRWYEALEESAVLSEASREQLLASHVMRGETGVGYGWFVSPTPQGTKSVWTRGYEGFGHGAVLATYPEERVVIIVTSNSGERIRDVPVSHKLAEDLAQIIFRESTGATAVPDPEAILGIRLPTDIPSLIATLGEPSAVELPEDDDPSPWGQWFRWDHEDGAATLSALGDDYSPSTPNRTAGVKFIELSSSGEGPPIKTIYGFDLNLTTRSEVESILQDAIQPSSLGGGDLYRDAVKYEQGGLYTYFFFGPDGQLTGVVQATIDVERAD